MFYEKMTPLFREGGVLNGRGEAAPARDGGRRGLGGAGRRS